MDAMQSPKPKYWLRGGVIGLIVLISGYLFLYLEGNEELTLSIILFFFGENPYGLMIFWFGVIYFLAGSLVGWIYGFIKSKITNQSSSQ